MTEPTLPSRLLEPSLLERKLLTGGLHAATAQPAEFGAYTFQLGPIGRCPHVPTLAIYAFDDSGSIGAVGGNDPIGRRYEEAWHAINALTRYCRCGREAAALLHFDTPTSRDVGPTPLADRSSLRHLGAGLAVPSDAAGASVLAPSLSKAYALAAQHPEHELTLCVLSDFWLFDRPSQLERLAAFPGKVYAVCLRAEPPPELIDDQRAQIVQVGYRDPPGTVAQAILAPLTAYRRFRSTASPTSNPDQQRHQQRSPEPAGARKAS